MKLKTKYKTIWNIIRNYKWKSTFFSYLKSTFLLLFIPTIILTSVLIYFYNSSNTKTMLMTNQQSSLKTKAFIENTFSEIEKIRNNVLSNSYATALILNSKENINSQESLNNITRILGIFNNYTITSETIESVYLYSLHSDYVFSSRQCTSLESFYDKSWYEIYKKNDAAAFTYASSLGSDSQTKNYLSLVYPINYGRTIDGLLIINLKASVFNEYIENSEASETIILADKNKNIVYSNDRSIIGAIYEKDIMPHENIVSEIKDDVITSYCNVENSDLIFIGKNHILKPANTYIIITIYFIVLVMFLVILSFIFSVRFYINISDLIVTANLSYDETKEYNYDEFKHLKDNILSNTTHISIIEDELIKKTNELKKSQQVALQLQIAPHFLLNTLNIVNLLLMRSEKFAPKAMQINSLLSEILTNVLKTNKYFITIEEEIKYTQKYIEIETYKTNNLFKVSWDVDKECLNCKTVKFLLQPIIENSVFHGIKYLEDKEGKIDISIKHSDNIIIFTVTDNGVGMNKETMNNLNNIFTASNSWTEKHIGLENVNKRLKIAYGNVHKLCILKSDATGTTIQFNIPLQK